MKHDIEYVCGLKYNLRMMGIPCKDPTFVYGDNKLVLSNNTVPAYNLKKNMNILSYKFVHK